MEIQHPLEQEAAQDLGQLHMVPQAEMEWEEVLDLVERQEEAEEEHLEVASGVEEEVDLAVDFEVAGAGDLVDNKLTSYPSDIQVSSKLL